MRNILIQTENDRGGQVRASTHNEKMELEVFFKVDGEVRKSVLTFENKNGGLTIWQDGKAIGLTSGEPSEKLPYRS